MQHEDHAQTLGLCCKVIMPVLADLRSDSGMSLGLDFRGGRTGEGCGERINGNS